MSQKKITASHFSPDLLEFIRLLYRFEVKYLIVGGEAVIYHGHARLTGDVDFFYEPSKENADKLFRALREFWRGDVPGVDNNDELLRKGMIFQFGRPPNRIDLINDLETVSFEEAWSDKEIVEMVSESSSTPVYYIGLEHLIKNKESIERPRDIEDLRFLNASNNKRGSKNTKD